MLFEDFNTDSLEDSRGDFNVESRDPRTDCNIDGREDVNESSGVCILVDPMEASFRAADESFCFERKCLENKCFFFSYSSSADCKEFSIYSLAFL